MNNIILLKKAHVFSVCLFAVIICSCKKPAANVPVQEPIETLSLTYQQDIDSCVAYLEKLKEIKTTNLSIENYIQARNYFKKTEAVLAFADAENYKTLNQPNLLKVEEEDATDIKIIKPFGFQVIEELIHEDSLDLNYLNQIIKKTQNRLVLIKNNARLQFKDYHVLWLIRDEINRIALTGVTGFDSPVLERSLDEAIINYESIQNILNIYASYFQSEALLNMWQKEIESSINMLKTDFGTFDRFDFIKNHTHKQLELILETKTDWNVEFPYALAFNNNLKSLFSKNTFNLSYFSSEQFDSLAPNKINLGEKLFYEKALSKDNSISCASCHLPEKHFTDGKKISDKVTRNSPTLLYAALQKGFFYDKRAGSLEGQIVAVVNNEKEFHSDLKHLEAVIKSNPDYTKDFDSTYVNGPTQENIRNAIATYIRSLVPFNSKFDNNINGLENNLTTSEKRGFNLFMGKAKCATCHFPPTFNGTVPILYKESEMELIGVPKTTDTINAVIDDDLGRYYVFNTKQKKHFFKTPTVRNANKTAPYMHNGVYDTLEEVIDFYNRGGGIGMGMELENQTLPADALNLTKQDTNDLMAFIKTLDDHV
ncbi:methylamine utilization protein [Tamlana fucoidanivorans]|uniref:Methylamine utilization protein n=1 Tax=Allotamlana fucoidanivorans TaxID=2583814 RepID=A0A5C4SKY1_9FLAO|nr:cytochrome c peroxidase [Tamlana fucoidanivorans]TNJ44546.1 methylamine utilization protein [Tamlana fucoidanivorans]